MSQLGNFIINHWMLWSLLLAVIIIILTYELSERLKKGQEINPQTAVKLINNENATVIDLRDEESYRKGHIINAIRASQDSFNNNQMDKYKTKPIILVCASGVDSQNLTVKLRQQGFTKPLILAGGITAWQDAELPLVKGK